MTQLLYYNDSYKREFEFKIIEVADDEKAVVLDRTAFYPGGGGQPCDRGSLIINEVEYIVNKVKKENNKIYHYLEGAIPELNDEGIGKLDWDYRYKLMRTHTAMHIISAVAWRDYQASVTGGDMDPLNGRMDFEFESFDKQLVEEIEGKINQEVKNGRDTIINILSREEAFKIPDLLRTKINLLPEGIEEIRTVEIVGLDLQADGGTHVKNTSEVGEIKIVKHKSKGAINKRIYLEIVE